MRLSSRRGKSKTLTTSPCKPPPRALCQNDADFAAVMNHIDPNGDGIDYNEFIDAFGTAIAGSSGTLSPNSKAKAKNRARAKANSENLNK